MVQGMEDAANARFSDSPASQFAGRPSSFDASSGAESMATGIENSAGSRWSGSPSGPSSFGIAGAPSAADGVASIASRTGSRFGDSDPSSGRFASLTSRDSDSSSGSFGPSSKPSSSFSSDGPG